MRFIKRVWRGECSLAIAWGAFVASVIFFSVIGVILAVMDGAHALSSEPSITPKDDADIKKQFITLSILGISGAIVYIWSLTGIWRSSRSSQKTSRIVSCIGVVLLGLYFVVIPVAGLVMGAVALSELKEAGGELKESLGKVENALKNAPVEKGAVKPKEDSAGEIDKKVNRINLCNGMFEKTYRDYGQDPSAYTQEREKYLASCVQ